MLPPLCAWILANGQPCNQFALRRRQFCRAHEKLARIEDSNHELRETLDLISTLDIQNLIALTQHYLDAVIRHTIAPARAQTIFEAAHQRLGVLLAGMFDDEAPNDPPSLVPQPVPRRSPHPSADHPSPSLTDFASAIAQLNRLVSINSGQQGGKIPANPAPSAVSTLTRAE